MRSKPGFEKGKPNKMELTFQEYFTKQVSKKKERVIELKEKVKFEDYMKDGRYNPGFEKAWKKVLDS